MELDFIVGNDLIIAYRDRRVNLGQNTEERFVSALYIADRAFSGESVIPSLLEQPFWQRREEGIDYQFIDTVLVEQYVRDPRLVSGENRGAFNGHLSKRRFGWGSQYRFLFGPAQTFDLHDVNGVVISWDERGVRRTLDEYFELSKSYGLWFRMNHLLHYLDDLEHGKGFFLPSEYKFFD